MRKIFGKKKHNTVVQSGAPSPEAASACKGNTRASGPVHLPLPFGAGYPSST